MTKYYDLHDLISDIAKSQKSQNETFRKDPSDYIEDRSKFLIDGKISTIKLHKDLLEDDTVSYYYGLLLPGIPKDKISIEQIEDTIKITTECVKNHGEKAIEPKLFRIQFDAAHFDGVSHAECKDGILRIFLKRTPETKPTSIVIK